MDAFLSVLIIVPTAAVVLIGALYIFGTIAVVFVAAVDATVQGLRHRFGFSGQLRHTHYGTQALPHT